MLPARLLSFVALSLICSSCVHLLQPQTYRPHQRIDLQQEEYLRKELVHGLSEETFRRWYTRTPAWRDPLRPSIASQQSADGATTYRITGDPGALGEVTFRDGRLEKWTHQALMQESIASVWMEQTAPGHPSDSETLARIDGLDPTADVLNTTDRPKRPTICRFETGDTIENTIPLRYDPERDNLVLGGVLPAARESPAGDRREPVMPAGTRFTVEAWDLVHGRRFTDAGGNRYRITDSTSLRGREGTFCPVGVCPRPGQVMRTTRDLEVGWSGDAQSGSLAVLDHRTRIPVWLRREMIPAGTQVVVRWWDLCDSMTAEIAVGAEAGFKGRAASVPFAPPDLFAPIPGT